MVQSTALLFVNWLKRTSGEIVFPFAVRLWPQTNLTPTLVQTSLYFPLNRPTQGSIFTAGSTSLRMPFLTTATVFPPFDIFLNNLSWRCPSVARGNLSEPRRGHYKKYFENLSCHRKSSRGELFPESLHHRKTLSAS